MSIGYKYKHHAQLANSYLFKIIRIVMFYKSQYDYIITY